MSVRLQVLIPPALDAQVSKAAQRNRMSKGEWVRRALQESLKRSRGKRVNTDPLVQLESLNAPTADIGPMLSEIEAGRT